MLENLCRFANLIGVEVTELLSCFLRVCCIFQGWATYRCVINLCHNYTFLSSRRKFREIFTFTGLQLLLEAKSYFLAGNWSLLLSCLLRAQWRFRKVWHSRSGTRQKTSLIGIALFYPPSCNIDRRITLVALSGGTRFDSWPVVMACIREGPGSWNRNERDSQ
jgi:hypothetical protein